MPVRPPGTPRDLGVDAVRGLALLSMYVAHTAPWDAPPLVRELSNLLTAALFATLVGVGFGLGGSGWGARRGRRRSGWWASLVRGGALVALGLVLTRVDSLVIIILVHLGLLTWAMALLTRAPLWFVACVGLVAFAGAPQLSSSLADDDARLEATGPGWLATLLDLAATGDAYRLTALLGWAVLGYLVARLLLHAPGRGRLALVAGLLLLTGAAAIVAGMDQALTGSPVVPYSGTHLELVTNALLAAGVLLVGAAATRLVAGHGVGWLAGLGRMTLTLYCLHVLALALAQQLLYDGGSPLGWRVTVSLALGSVAVALAWDSWQVTRRWGRGPLEGVVERVARRTR